MFNRLIVAAVIVLLSTVLLQAHGGATHLLGTVTAVSKDTVTIKDKAGKSLVVMLEKDTKYLRDKKPVTIGDLTVGSRVVIDAKMDPKTKNYTAEEVQVGVAATDSKQDASKPGAQKSATQSHK